MKKIITIFVFCINLFASSNEINQKYFNAINENNITLLSKLLEDVDDINSIKNSKWGGDSLLMEAIEKQSFPMVKLLIKKGANVNYVDLSNDFTPLKTASDNNDLEIMQYLIENGANINATGMNGSALFSILKTTLSDKYVNLEERKKSADYLIKKGIDIELKDDSGNTALTHSLKNGNIQAFKYLLSKGANINAQDKKGETVLFYLVSFYNIKHPTTKKLINFVLDNNIKVDIENKYNNTALQVAVILGLADKSVCKIFVEHGANIYKFSGSYYESIVDLALYNENELLAKYFISLDKKLLDLQDPEGNTSLHKAVKNKQIKQVKFLVEAGADVNIPNENEETPIFYSLYKKDKDIFVYLVEHGADIYKEKEYDRSLLNVAIRSKQLDIVNYLLNKDTKNVLAINEINDVIYDKKLDLLKIFLTKNIDINTADKSGKFPLEIAIKTENLSIVKYILDNGANIYIKDKKGRNFLQKTIKYNYNPEIFEYLINLDKKNFFTNSADNNGRTLLFDAIKSEKLNLIETLVNNSVDIYHKDKQDNNIMDIALETYNNNIINYFINIDKKNKLFPINTKMVFEAIKLQNEQLLKLLISKDISLNTKNKKGQTPFTFALLNDYIKMAKVLLDKGVDTHNIGDIFTAFSSYRNALVQGSNEEVLIAYDIVKELVEKNDLSILNQKKDDLSLMHLASNSIVLMKLLIDKKVDINKKDKNGLTPLFYAVIAKNLKTVKLLVKSGAKTDVKNKKGRTVFQISKDLNEKDITKILNKR
ncbi:ankyrin repeat domain-containing protein [Arcobacter sp.]|uniref:ankyrin repeat domain-containing protein n=1 Tax=Arcobacter sp. TaxID=1872629 RepID=UPI003C72F4F5